MIKFSAPGKIHLLGEHAVVYGKPALLAAVDLRVSVTISTTPSSVIPTNVGIQLNNTVKTVIEPIIKKEFHFKKLSPYHLTINSEAPIGAGLGSSAAISASYIAALLTFLKVKWDLNLINNLTYEAEKVFHGNPSGADQSAVIFGGLIWFRKETEDLKLIHPLNIKFSQSRNFVFINTGKPKESTKEMVTHVKQLYAKKPNIVNQFLENQESLVRQLLLSLKTGDSALMIRIIRAGEKNLESIGVVSKYTQKIIREIEKIGGAAKICGAGSDSGPTGVLLCYHKDTKVVERLAKSYNLPYFSTKLGDEGLRLEQ